jgi:ribosomal-protein-alanine N-acetyltransferase
VPRRPSLTTRLATPRLTLRAARESDVPLLFHALRRNNDYLRAWSPAPAPGEKRVTLTLVAREIARWRSLWRRDDTYAFYLFPREDPSVIIGRITLGRISRGVFQNAYTGYWIDRERQGTGLMTEAMKAALGFAFDRLGLHRVQAAIMPHNPGSIRVAEKCGFRKEGYAERYLKIADRWEDHVIFAITEEERQPLQADRAPKDV